MKSLLLAPVLLLAGMAWGDKPPAEKDRPPYERLLEGADDKAAEALEDRIDALQRADKCEEAVQAAEELAALRTRVQGADHWEVRDVRIQLATLRQVAALAPEDRKKILEAKDAIRQASRLKDQGKYAEALPLLEKAVAIRRQALGDEHPYTAIAYTRLGINLKLQGRYAQAQPLFDKALASYRKNFGETHPYTSDGYVNLAHLMEAQGKYSAAQPLLEKALDIDRKIHGEDHRDTATSYHNLAANLHYQGKYAEALPLQQKTLVLVRKAFGDEHPNTAGAYTNLADTLDTLAKFEEAQPLHEKALAICRKALGEEHPTTATVYNNLAVNLNYQGKYAEAQLLCQKALAVHLRTLGEKHPDTANSYINLASNVENQGRYAEAQSLFEKALASWREALGENHPSTAVGYNKLGTNLDLQKKYLEAQTLHEKALAIKRRALGEEHPDTGLAYNALAMNLNYQGKYAEALPLFEKALAILRKAFGDEHPDTAVVYANLAHTLNALQKYAEAQRLYEKALAIKQKVLGQEHPETADVYHNLAVSLADQVKYAEAQPLYEKALAVRDKALGKDHPLTALSSNDLALNLMAQHKYTEAQPLFERALASFRHNHGEVHTNTDAAYGNLAMNLNAQGKYVEALTTLERAIHSYEGRRLNNAAGLQRSAASGFHTPYPLTAAILARLGRPAEAWHALEHDLARGLLDQMAEQGLHGLTPDEQQKHAAATERLGRIRSRLFFLHARQERSDVEQKELDALSGEQRRLETELADLGAAQSKREVASLDVVRQALPVDAALVAWVDISFAGVDEHWACLVRPAGEPIWVRQVGTGPDKQWTRKDNALLDRLKLALVGDRITAPATADEVAALADAVRAQRLAPLEKHLQGVKTLVVVPVRRMSGFPVEVLTDRYRVSYVPSGTFLARLKDRPKPGGDRVLALGDPRFDLESSKSTPVGPLPPGGLLVNQVLPTGNAAVARIIPGDVILTYADTDIKNLEHLLKLIADNASKKTVPVTVWRDGKAGVRDVPSGKLGLVLDKVPAPEAIAAKRKTDELLASVRGGEWKELPGTRIELARLADLFGKDRLTVLADVHATEPELEALRTADRLKEFRYLHFATHGEANHFSAFQSQLILAQDKAARDATPRAGQPTLDGKLTAREVLEFWKLDAELVTLSACDTALGSSGGGDGQLGFAQAFLTAGSRAVCLSLWKVDDSATALLMDRFYQNLTGKRDGLKVPMGKADALAEAKTWLRNLSLEEATQRLGTITDGVARGKDQPALKVVLPVAERKANPKEVKPFAHPRYWAAFVLIGDPN